MIKKKFSVHYIIHHSGNYEALSPQKPINRNTYNFHYTLDNEDNVDNIKLIEIEKQ